jgi:hypothetical protein
MRLIAASVLSLAMASSAVLAADNAAPLPAGKPAGVHDAQMGDNTLLIGLGVGAFVAAVVVLATDSGNNNVTAGTSTTATSTGTSG